MNRESVWAYMSVVVNTYKVEEYDSFRTVLLLCRPSQSILPERLKIVTSILFFLVVGGFDAHGLVVKAGMPSKFRTLGSTLWNYF